MESLWELPVATELSRRLTTSKYKNFSATQSQDKMRSVMQSNTSFSPLLEFILAVYIKWIKVDQAHLQLFAQRQPCSMTPSRYLIYTVVWNLKHSGTTVKPHAINFWVAI